MSVEPAEAMDQVYDVIIIGAGPGGSTAALYAARAGFKTLVIHRGAGTGAYALADRVANYPGVPGEISGLELVARMNGQAASFGAQFLQDSIGMVDVAGDPKSVSGNQGYYRGRALIVATGAMGRGEPLPGEERLVGRGVSYCATCDGAFFRDQVVAVVGNGSEAVEEALFLTRFASVVHLLAPGQELRVPAEEAAHVAANERIALSLGTRVLEILGDEDVTGLRLSRGGQQEELAVSGAFVYLQGRQPITGFLGDQVARSEGGCLEVNEMMETNVPGVFAVGDVLCNHLKQVVVAAADGAIAAKGVERFLSGRSQLRPDWH